MTLFCSKCAPLASQLAYDPAAESFAEMLSGSLIWRDETARGWCTPCAQATRKVFHLRYCMTVGDPLDPEAVELWQRLEQEFPNWPLFRPDRRSPENGPELRRTIDSKTEQFWEELQQITREWREEKDLEKGP